MQLRPKLLALAFPVVLGAWTPDDMLKVKTVGDVQVSPDGHHVAFTVTQHDLQKSEPVTQVWVACADVGIHCEWQLSHGTRSASSPRWSPDGRRIAYLSSQSGVNNVWVVEWDGGSALQLTWSRAGVSAFRWSNNGRFVAFTASKDVPEEDQRRKQNKEDWRVLDADFAYERLWVIPAILKDGAHPAARLLTRQNYHLGGAFGGGFLDWSPDDRKIVFAHMPRPRFDDWRKLDIAEADVGSGEIRAVSETPAAEDTPMYSPDGKWIAFRRSDEPPGWAKDFRIFVVPASGGTPQPLADTFNREPTLLGWSADSHSVIVQEARGTIHLFYRLPLDGPPATLPMSAPVVQGSITGASLNQTRSTIGFSLQDSTTPPEAYLLRLEGSTFQVSRVNSTLSKLPLGRTQAVRWEGPGGLEVEGLLTYPVDYRAGKRYPLITISHGGPPSNFSQVFIAMPSPYPIAALATRGYAVLRSNVRGSTGYGKSFRYANYLDWGHGDFLDMMAGVDKVIEMGIADPDRLGVAGWSYGGYMTSWAITQTHRFRAASIGAPVADLGSLNGTADMATFVPDYFHGESWEKPDLYTRHSPLYNAKGVNTPALIQQGSEDTVVPLGQGLEYYNALVQQGTPARMVVYPRSGHGVRESKFVRHLMLDNLAWFDKYLRH
jgi:dipeptidyl aminopeptidase/acylaminoacyl peptidase